MPPFVPTTSNTMNTQPLHFVTTLIVSIALGSGVHAWQTPVHSAPIVSAAEPPAGTATLRVQWMEVSAPGGGVMLLAVARPKGAGPFPAVFYCTYSRVRAPICAISGGSGAGGVLAVAACWFSGGSGGGSRFITPIGCADAPPVTVPSSPDAKQRVATLLHAVRLLPEVRPHRVAIFGHSRGGGAASQYLLTANHCGGRTQFHWLPT